MGSAVEMLEVQDHEPEEEAEQTLKCRVVAQLQEKRVRMSTHFSAGETTDSGEASGAGSDPATPGLRSLFRECVRPREFCYSPGSSPVSSDCHCP